MGLVINLMNSDNQYQKLLRSRVASAIAQAKAVATLSHQGVKGNVLEILISQLFEPLLPADVGIGTGQIIDCFGNLMSNQIDIIIYNKAILPPILVDGKLGVFPIESVLYAIEVKTTLTAKELRIAHNSALFLDDKLSYLHGMKDEMGNELNHSIEKVRSVVFALSSDLTGKKLNEAERYKKIYGDGKISVRSICVAEREYWYEDDGNWIGITSGENYDEILGFIGGVTNTYKEVAISRGRPSLGHYIVPRGNEISVVSSYELPLLTITCQGCGKEKFFVPDLDRKDMVHNGRFISNEKCNECGGDMCSEEANYVFKKGRLHEINPKLKT